MKKLILCIALIAPVSLRAQFLFGDYKDGWRLNATCTDATTLVIDASGEKVAFVFRAPRTGNIASVRFKLGTVTTADDLTVSLQNVDLATGDPDGTQDQTATVAVADTDDNAWKTATFGSARAVTAGDAVAVVIEVGTYVDANLTITAAHSQASPYQNSIWSELQTGGVWAKQGTHGPLFSVIYDGAGGFTYVPTRGTIPVNDCALINVGTGTTPDEVGLVFQLSTGLIFRGAHVVVDADGDFDVVLYDASNNVLSTMSTDANLRNASGVNASVYPMPEVTLSASTTYRLVLKPITATTMNFLYANVVDNAILGSWPLGANAYWTQRVDAGSWTDTNTRMPYIGLVGSPTTGGAGPTPTSHTFIQ